MKHYPHHISDFNNATRHLSRVERSLYRDLVELYYETEMPLPSDVQALCRRILATEFSTDVERLLNEFFTQTPMGWYHERCEEEISKYQANNSQRAQAGKASAAKRLLKKQQALNGKATTVETPLNGTPTEKQNQSTNQPINHKEKKSAIAPPPRPEDVSEQVWGDWLQLRKTKRAAVSQTVLDEARAESLKAGLPLERFLAVWCARGSQGMQAEWLKPHERAGAKPGNTHKFAAAAKTIFGNDSADDRRTIDA